MPLPIPFYLRLSQPNALTYGEMDGNFTILSQKIDNTVGVNVGSGIGIYLNKTVNANDGALNFRSISGSGGIGVSLIGDEIVITDSGSGGTSSDCCYWTAGTGTNAVKLIDNFSEASGNYSVAEGTGTTASGNYSHAEGTKTLASGIASHAEGGYEGDSGFLGTSATTDSSHAEGFGTLASGVASHAEGSGSHATNTAAHAEGKDTLANGNASHAEGEDTRASGEDSHAEGKGTIASGGQSHSEGALTSATGDSAHAEGILSKAHGESAHAEGQDTLASGDASHAEGWQTIASAHLSHTEGRESVASGVAAHAEGYATIASGGNSHTEGAGVIAGGLNSHAGGNVFDEDNRIIASGETSFVHFERTTGSTGGTAPIGAYATNSVILGGRDHNIEAQSNDSAILGGLRSEIKNTSSFRNVILGGQDDKIINRVSESAVIAGRDNSINGVTTRSSIIGGINNFMEGGAGGTEESTIIAGSGNTLSEGKVVGLFVTQNSTGDSSNYGAILGGRDNFLKGAMTLGGMNNTVILGGENITATVSNSAYVPQLNIGTVRTTPTIGSLGIDSSGFVTTGTTSSGGTFNWCDPYVRAGNTSGCCIDKLWVTTLSGCSPLYLGGANRVQGVQGNVNVDGILNIKNQVNYNTQPNPNTKSAHMLVWNSSVNAGDLTVGDVEYVSKKYLFRSTTKPTTPYEPGGPIQIGTEVDIEGPEILLGPLSAFTISALTGRSEIELVDKVGFPLNDGTDTIWSITPKVTTSTYISGTTSATTQIRAASFNQQKLTLTTKDMVLVGDTPTPDLWFGWGKENNDKTAIALQSISGTTSASTITTINPTKIINHQQMRTDGPHQSSWLMDHMDGAIENKLQTISGTTTATTQMNSKILLGQITTSGALSGVMVELVEDGVVKRSSMGADEIATTGIITASVISATTVIVDGVSLSASCEIDEYETGVTATDIWDWDVSGNSTNFQITLGAASPYTLNIDNVRNGEYGTVIVNQDAIGGRTLIFGTINGSAGTHYVVNGGGGVPTLTEDANATDILSFTYNGTAAFWNQGNDYT